MDRACILWIEISWGTYNFQNLTLQCNALFCTINHNPTTHLTLMYAHCVQFPMASKVMSIDPFRFLIPQCIRAVRSNILTSGKCHLWSLYVYHLKIWSLCLFLLLHVWSSKINKIECQTSNMLQFDSVLVWFLKHLKIKIANRIRGFVKKK